MSINSGFNRMGLYFDAGLDASLNGNQFHLGARYYGPDYVFETNTVGLSAAYQYIFSNGGWYFGPGVSAAFFREKKTTTNLFLSEIMLRNTLGYEFAYRLAVYSNLGLGSVINTHKNDLVETSTLSYINYEFSVGIKYYWRSYSDN